MKKYIAWGLVLSVLLIGACKDNDSASYGEGTISNPVLLTVGQAHNATIASAGINYYKFQATADDVHTISLTNVQSDLSWDLYDDAGFTNSIGYCDDYFYAADESGQTPALTLGTIYYLTVDEWDYVEGTFTILITQP